jgi:hypothetical protein
MTTPSTHQQAQAAVKHQVNLHSVFSNFLHFGPRLDRDVPEQPLVAMPQVRYT